MTENPSPQKIPLIFFRSGNATEPVREWLKELPEAERHAVGKDLLRGGEGERHFGLERGSVRENVAAAGANGCLPRVFRPPVTWLESDRKSTRLNSSHLVISYA